MALVDVVVPEDQQEGTESVLATWLKQPGEAVTEHEPLVEISTDKAVVEIPAPASGVLEEILVQPDTPVSGGMLLGKIAAGASEQPGSTQEAGKPQSLAQAAHATNAALERYKGLRVSPAVKRLAAKLNVDLKLILGTGHAGRITKKDLEKHLGRDSAPTSSVESPKFDTSEIPSKRVPHDIMRKKIAQHMAYSVQVAPHVTSVFECDLSNVIAHRSANKAEFSKRGANLTFTAYFVQASVAALTAVPEVNSRFHPDALELFTDINIGVGTALGEKGLVVPVIHRAQELDLFTIAQKLTDLTEKGRAGKLTPAEMANGTFTISNHGVSGSLLASPIIINQPQSAILGVGKLEKRAIVQDDDSIVVRPMMYVTLTIDHRALDAHQTNQFLTEFVKTLEEYA